MKLFKKMKKTAVFINCSRGSVVNQDDLLEALKTNVISAAGKNIIFFSFKIFFILVKYLINLPGLDVTYPEPLKRDHELFRLKNCLITPHLGSSETRCRKKMFEITVENIVNGLNGRPLVSEIKHSD